MLMSGSTTTRPARSNCAPARSASTLPRREARTPAAHSTVCVGDPLVLAVHRDGHAVGIDLRDASARCASRTPRAINCLSAFAERSGGKVGRTRGSPSTSRIAASRGSMWRKSWRTVSLAISPSAPASSTPVGPPPTMTKFSQARALRRVGLALGALEGQQQAAADLGGVLDRLQAGSELLPLVVAEIVVRGAGGDDQRVVGHLAVAQR